MQAPAPIHLPESAARRVLLVQAFETGPAEHPQWSADDRAWATRAAREDVAAGADPARFLERRAHHALQRLAPREAVVRRTLEVRGWRSGWMLWALVLGLLAGLGVDAIGSAQRINLLAPPVWLVIVWNLLVYIGVLLPLPGLRWVKSWLTRRMAGGAGGGATAIARFRAAWLQQAAALHAARAAQLLHAAAAALAVGLIASLYVRGLVLDYRAGWQSTFLDAGQVHAALSVLLAPALSTTGIALPDLATLQALRVGGGGPMLPLESPLSSAAPWIHLYAVMLLLFVVLPRSLLALWAGARGGFLTRRLPLSVGEPYFQRLLLEHGGSAARVQLLTLGSPPSPHLLACLQTVLRPLLGQDVQLEASSPASYGREEDAAALQPPAGTSLRLLLVDLASTPEDDSHGALVRALRKAAASPPLLVLADEAAFRARFAGLPARLAERRKVWLDWATASTVGLVCIDLAQPDIATAERDLRANLR